MKKSDAAKRQGLKSMSKRRSGEKSSKRLGKIIPRDSKNKAAATTIKIVIATAPFLVFQEAAVGGDGDDAQGDRFAAGGEGLAQGVF